MGREVQRVPLNFKWPLGKHWAGYINPYFEKKCPECGGDGLTNAGRVLEELAIELAYRLPTRPGGKEVCEAFGFEPEPWRTSTFFDRGSVWKKLNEWGDFKDLIECPHCDGNYVDPEFVEDFENWQAIAPPNGDGWQLWETVSSGSPITPVFETPEELAEYCATSKGEWFGGHYAKQMDYEKWLIFIKREGWAASAVSGEDGLMVGTAYAAERLKEDG